MKHQTQFLKVIFILIGYASIGQGLNDGPYVFIESNGLVQKSIVNSKVVSEVLDTTAYDTIYTPESSTFSDVKKIAALSDIHGQYDLAVEILMNNKIIDEALNWSFDTGHLVIVGDIFDRGPKVNEMLWLIYKLEQQAKDKGGHLHFLLGNHEYMVLHKDLRYIHERYLEVGTLLDLEYDEMYDNRTVIGRWLRSKSTILSINNHMFVHGGISQDFLNTIGFDIEAINESIRASIDIDKTELKTTDFYANYYGSTGPIWYRGYFTDNLEDTAIDDVLSMTKSEHIVVGHCSFDEVIRAYDGKIYGVDSSIKKGIYGELLFIEHDRYYRGTKDGTRKDFE